MTWMQRITQWFGRKPATGSERQSLSPEELQWLISVLGSLYRKTFQVPAQVNTVPEDLPGVLDAVGLRARALTWATWRDEAHTPLDTKGLVVGGATPLLVLGRKEGEALVLKPGASKPEMVPVTDLVAQNADAIFYAVSLVDPEESSEAFGWRWFFKAFLSRKKVVRDVLAASLVVQLIGLAFPLATQAVVDKVITNQAMSTLVALGIGIALFSIANATLSWLKQKLLLRLANVVDAELSVRVMLHLFRLPLRYFEARATGSLITRVKGVSRVREFASSAFLMLALEIPFMFIFLALMLGYSWQLSGTVLIFVSGMVGLSFACGPHLRGMANKQFEAGAKTQAFLTERVAAYETVKSLQLESTSVSEFAELNRKELNAGLRLREFANGYSSFMQMAEQLMSAAVLCLGAYLAMTSTHLTIGMLVAFQMFAQRVSQPLLKLSGMWQELQQIRTAVAQLGEVMSTPTERYGSSPTSLGKVKGALAVEALSFRHAPDRPPLYTNLNFTVEPGQVTLITGPSGSGKSTLSKVMQGLYQSYEGFVRVDGRDIRSMTVNELRDLFGVVPQETILFAGTILDNVLAGGQATMEQAVQACRMAGIHTAIENMAEGYQTVIGERGVGLSGGQRQRIGIARALLKRPVVLIFDEATSGLDDASSEHIGQTVNYLRGKVTVLFVAHKVPTCLQVDAHVRL
ncbi:peptidase domain-containing ABC transporter [Burkholderia ubonensis]|uniref:peptidase domain-containing ABC transporter n=1 Tax=Burkholderia ubonensis TaxID=101571 RepID=UPI00075EA1D6|nr:peptidase domain-containing ABC transporter [Burkholderia ubonensis]KVP16873.1 hypothetical protein WJ84_00950 [Burkholderia ubonensis]